MEPKTGLVLAEDMEQLLVELNPLVDQFLYEETATLIAADPGTGKSTIATQLALCLSSGTPLFGVLEVPRPRKVYYLQMEGAYRQSLDRMRHMRQVIALNPDNLCWDAWAVVNALKESQINQLVERIAKVMRPDLVVIDPLYMCVSGGLSKDEPASAFVQFSTRLMKDFGCSNLLLHHTTKPTYSQRDGKAVEKEDPFYGSQWIKAHVDTSYYLKAADAQQSGVILERKKDRNGCVLPKLVLQYQPETFTCFMEQDGETRDVVTRVLTYLRSCRQQQRETDFYEVLSAVKCSVRQLRNTQTKPELMAAVEFVERPGKRTIWRLR